MTFSHLVGAFGFATSWFEIACKYTGFFGISEYPADRLEERMSNGQMDCAWSR